MPVTSPAPRAPGSRRLPLIVGLLTMLLLAFGLTGATATSGTTGVAITPLTPVRTITAGVSVAAGKTWAFVATGGTTTVPTNALVVELAITVKGTKAGTLSFAPLGEPGNGSPSTVSWAAGGSGAGTVKVNVGNSNKVVVTNSSLAAATVGVKITGYATLVTAAGISGVGGADGTVLTNQGNGTVGWEPVPQAVRVYVAQAGYSIFGPVTSSRDSLGVYRVNFGRLLATCTVTAMPGSYANGSWNVLAHLSVTSSPGSSIVTVLSHRTDTAQPVDTGFFLTVTC
ncbi:MULTISPECIES: hypothetical protein [unclassified Nocardioides]|uniref:hypothetical protein n=1 Tax=unclassified Nocardioides TaxID=2615069 RepID=UPI0006F4CDD2|nr:MULTISPECIES: hypothetical protein [unclassified Nocardioides]KRA30855.1 hypothetical protein ASD81_15185 [Nocardioides sp. Root614]KRA87475.1 hypothetical protein ASD84_15455 [Nocardioides sp. Root682]